MGPGCRTACRGPHRNLTGRSITSRGLRQVLCCGGPRGHLAAIGGTSAAAASSPWLFGSKRKSARLMQSINLPGPGNRWMIRRAIPMGVFAVAVAWMTASTAWHGQVPALPEVSPDQLSPDGPVHQRRQGLSVQYRARRLHGRDPVRAIARHENSRSPTPIAVCLSGRRRS